MSQDRDTTLNEYSETSDTIQSATFDNNRPIPEIPYKDVDLTSLPAKARNFVSKELLQTDYYYRNTVRSFENKQKSRIRKFILA